MGISATYTNVGLNLIAGSQIGGSSAAVTYVAIGTGTGVLSSGVTSGIAITSLPVVALAANVAAGQQLAIAYGTTIDYVTVTAAGALAGATAIPIVSWTPAFSFPSGSGLVNMPALTDIQLQAETFRTPVSGGTAGVGAGETLISGYADPTGTPTGTYVEVGWFGGVAATATTNSGILIARGVVFWQHTQNLDSSTFQLDGSI